jgi:hypothetical protein
MQTNDEQTLTGPVEAIVHTDQSVEAAVLAFCQARRDLEQAVREEFPIGCRVAVKLDTVTCIAVVHAYVAGFPDRLALLFENGNVWDKAVTRISRLV